MIDVRLEPSEISLGVVVGGWRVASALQHDRPAAHGYNGDPFLISVHGACAELAVAKHTGLYWNALAANGDLRNVTADVGEKTQVRSSDNPVASLILHPGDPDDHEFWLVLTGDMPTYHLYGPIFAHEGKQKNWWRTNVRSPAYFVPQSALEAPHAEWVDDWVAADPLMAAEEHPDYDPFA